MSPVIAGVGGLLVGLAIGWFIGLSLRSGPSANAPEITARQRALEDERQRLAHELSVREKSIAQLSQAQSHAVNAAEENRRLLRRVQDLETALKSATSEETPSQTLQMQLAMALRERDAAQRAYMELEAKRAIDRSRPPPGSFETESFDALPELDDTDEETEDLSSPPVPRHDADVVDPAPERHQALPTMPPPDPSDELEDAPTELDEPTDDEADGPDDAPPAGDPAPTAIDDPAPDEAAAEVRRSEPDDFTVITGVGPATQKKLVALGYLRLSDLASLSDEGLAELERELGSRRPSRDDWRGQVEALLSSR